MFSSEYWVTNLRHTVVEDRSPAGISLLRVEATSPPFFYLKREDSPYPLLYLPGARIRFPAGLLRIHDGLLEAIGIEEKNGLVFRLFLAHPTLISCRRLAGLPARLEIEISRAPLYRIMRGRRVLIDPAHGGEESGGRGPVDLREKDKVLTLALLLRRELEAMGAVVFLTREGDQNPPLLARLAAAARYRPEAVIVLHLGCFPDPRLNGFRTSWINEAGYPLATAVHRSLAATLPLPDRGLGMGPPWGLKTTPVISVECATITNPVEEGWLRSSTFLHRAARAVATGIKDYFAGKKT